jgi:hypothetical protein
VRAKKATSQAPPASAPKANGSEAREPSGVAERSTVPTQNTSAPSESGLDRKTVAFYENAKGKIDVSKMQERTKEQLIRLLKDSDLARDLGVAGPVGGAGERKSPEPITLEMVFGLYSVIGTADSLVAQKVLKIPHDIASQAFTFTPAQKDGLAPLTRNILNKRFGALIEKYLGGYEEEALLATMLVGVIRAQYVSARKMQRQLLAANAGKPVFTPAERAARPVAARAPVSAPANGKPVAFDQSEGEDVEVTEIAIPEEPTEGMLQ